MQQQKTKPSWECREFFKTMEEKDAEEFINRHIQWLEEQGYQDSFIQARIMQLNMSPGLTVKGIIDRGEI